jgi:autophagy-related protein 5
LRLQGHFVAESRSLDDKKPPPPPFYCLLPRCSYLPLVSEDIRSHFLSYTGTDGKEMWFDSGGEPLKWHMFIGVLFDIFADPASLPWNLTVHFREFPSQNLLQCESQETVRNLFFQNLKEAFVIKHRALNCNFYLPNYFY